MTEAQQIVIPIETSFSCVFERYVNAVMKLWCCSTDEQQQPIPIPSDFYVIASRFGTIRTAFNEGTRYILGYHDIYTVWYKEVVLRFEPNAVMDVRVFRDDAVEQMGGTGIGKTWFRLVTQVV